MLAGPKTILRRQLTLGDHRIRDLPVLVLMPHSACNCRCVMCDIWQANARKQTLSEADLAPHLEDFRRLGVAWVVLSGGEALMHPNLFALCAGLERLGARITLLSTGLLLGRHAADIVRHIDEVIVSLDGPPAIHDDIRRIPRAFDQLAAGVAALRAARAGYPVTARSVIQRRNAEHLGETIRTAQVGLGLDRLSFLTADVSSTAFNRPDGWPAQRSGDVALPLAEVERFEAALERALVEQADAFSSGFVAESPARLRSFAAYFRAVAGSGDFPPVRCNAPWTSAVVEADGRVRPCFFHDAYGSLGSGFARVLNSPEAIAWRRGLDMATNDTCRRCVCSLHIDPWQAVR